MPIAVRQGLMPFGEYRPDVADYETQYNKDTTNVFPQGDGYGPFPSFTAFSSSLPAACRGMFYALKNDGSIAIFAGTATDLYLLNNTNQTWTNVSSSPGAYSLANNANWSFVQFNNFVIATNVNNVVQSYDLTSSTNFAALGGSPPQAAYAAVVNRFLVLSGLASPNVYRVQWSGLNAITTWDNITNLSNFQDMADGGIVRGVQGGDIGYIFQDRSIRQMIFQPGSSLIFGINRISQDDGLLAPYSLVMAAGNIFFYSPQGFKMLQAGANAPTPIGKERVDRTFLNNLDTGNLQFFVGSADPQKQRVYWAYKSVNGSAGVADSWLIYDYVLDRWATAKEMVQFIAPLSKPGLTLEQVDAAYGAQNGASHVISSVVMSSGTAVFKSTATTTGHGQKVGQGILLSTATSALPNGFSTNTPYYIKSTGFSTLQFELSAGGGVGSLESSAVPTTSTSTAFTPTFIVPSIETLTISSLDNISIGAAAAIGGAANGAIGFFTGPNLQATLETAEHGNVYQRIFVRGVRPITDASSSLVAISERENIQTAQTYSTGDPVDARGFVPARVDTRYARAKLTITAGTTWTFAAGVEPDITVEGQR